MYGTALPRLLGINPKRRLLERDIGHLERKHSRPSTHADPRRLRHMSAAMIAIDEARRCDVFEMLIERLGRLEAAEDRRAAAERTAAEWAPEHTCMSASLFGGPDVAMIKRFTAADSNDGGSLYEITGYLETPHEYDSVEWMRGDAAGPFDDDLVAAWGADKLREVRSAALAFYVPPVGARRRRVMTSEVGLTAADGLVGPDVSLANAALAAALQRLVPEVKWSKDMCCIVYEAPCGEALAVAAKVLRAAKQVVGRTDLADSWQPSFSFDVTMFKGALL